MSLTDLSAPYCPGPGTHLSPGFDYSYVDEDEDQCWGWGICHPAVSNRDEEECSVCPAPNPATWRVVEDLEYTVTCRTSSATVSFDLEKVAEVGWLDGYTVELNYTDTVDMSRATTRTIADYSRKEDVVQGIMSNYMFCLNFMEQAVVAAAFCKVALTFLEVLELICFFSPATQSTPLDFF